MDLGSVLAYLAAAIAVVVGLMLLWRERARPGSLAFALGMIAIAAREVTGVLAVHAVFDAQTHNWLRLRLLAETFVPAFFIGYSLSFARTNYREFRRSRRLLVALFVIAPMAVLAAKWSSLLVSQPPIPLPSWLVPIDWYASVLYAIYLVGAVVVLTHGEATLRASSGAARWQIKFLVLGMGAFFGVQVFLHSQVLLDSWIRTTLFPLGSLSVLVASALVMVSIVRRRKSPVSVFVSKTNFFGSVSLLVVAVYLLAVAGLVDVIRAIAGNNLAPFVAFVLGLVALAAVFLSSELQHRAKGILNRYFQRPAYDYRGVWEAFTRNTGSVLEIAPLCAGITKTAAETFGCSVATVWLVTPGPGEDKLSLGGSTAVSEERARKVLGELDGGRALIEVTAANVSKPLDLSLEKTSDAANKLFAEMEARYAVALLGGGDEPIGFLTLNERITKEPFGVEELSLFKTLGDQSAAALENRNLTLELQRAKEMETFQTLTTFFVHDLKNLASRLSLSMQNLPAHFDKPEFRKDLLETMARSVDKIDTMTSRLSSISKGMELEPAECDVNALVIETLSGLNGTMKAELTNELGELPLIHLDRDQIQKVLTNLILNAQDAAGDAGHIRVSTSRENGWVLVCVRDDGCGMSKEFMASSLFKPFQTTKKQGLGIGLFHCKKIVEAHGGRIEVESERGEGASFRVLLPSKKRSVKGVGNG
jgi:putative PEP-CTERM system histidine kinase